MVGGADMGGGLGHLPWPTFLGTNIDSTGIVLGGHTALGGTVIMLTQGQALYTNIFSFIIITIFI